ncbi:MAG: PKD domain-containing protein, partial [Holophaga sp.]|nr:PKD domain-containing protein [Holophaga sp.]
AINQNVGAVTGSSQTVSPTSTLTYTLTATNATGSSTATATVTVTPVTPDTTAPSVPTGLTASAITTTGLTLTWTAATDNIAVTGYRVYRGTATAPIATVTTGTTYTDTGLTAATAYSYTVAAFDAAGNVSAQSSPRSVTTATAPTLPPVISSFTASPNLIQAGQSAELTWVVGRATALSIDQGVGTVTGTSTTVRPATSTTYTLTATGGGGTVTAQVRVNIGSVGALNPTFTVLPGLNLEVGEECLFNAEGTTYSNADHLRGARYEWDFGDGTFLRYGYPSASSMMSGIATTHFFMRPGTFNATLTVKVFELYLDTQTERWEVKLPENLLATETFTRTITVTGEAPLAGFLLHRAPFQARLAQFITTKLPASITADATNRLVVTLTGDNGHTSTLLNKVGLVDGEKFLLEQRTLPAGNYRLVAELRSGTGQHLSQWVEKFAKPYAGIPTWGINEWNAICLNGRPTFPVTPYMTDLGVMPTYKANGIINMLHTMGYYNTQNPAAWVDFLSKAKAQDWPVIGPGRGSYMARANGRFSRNVRLSELQQYIQASAADDSQIALWHWEDEPNMGGRNTKIPPSVLAAWSHITHRSDPTRAVSVNMYGYDYLPHYGTAGTEYDYINSAPYFGGKPSFFNDMLNMDVYPIGFRHHASLNKPDRGVVELWVESLENFRVRNLDLIPLSPFVEVCQLNDGRPIPTSEEVLMEAWLAVVHEMKGVHWFDYFIRDTIRFDAAKKFTDAMNRYGEIVLGPSNVPQTTDTSNVRSNRVDTLTRRDGTTTYLFAVRLTEPTPTATEEQIFEPDTITTTFTMPGMTTGTVEVINEAGAVQRTTAMSGGTFTDAFEKCAIRIYRIKP